MAEIGIFEAKTKFSELCTLVEESGAEYIITRRGRPIARITPLADANSKGVRPSGILERMARTEAEHGKIPEHEPDFPEVWTERRSKAASPLDGEI